MQVQNLAIVSQNANDGSVVSGLDSRDPAIAKRVATHLWKRHLRGLERLVSRADAYAVERIADHLVDWDGVYRGHHWPFVAGARHLASVLGMTIRSGRRLLKRLCERGLARLLWAGTGRKICNIYELLVPGFRPTAAAESNDPQAPMDKSVSRGRKEDSRVLLSGAERRTLESYFPARSPAETLGSAGPLIEEEESDGRKKEEGGAKNGDLDLCEGATRSAPPRPAPSQHRSPELLAQLKKQKWEQRICTEVIRAHGPEAGFAIIEDYERGGRKGRKIFNSTSDRLRAEKEAAARAAASEGNAPCPT